MAQVRPGAEGFWGIDTPRVDPSLDLRSGIANDDLTLGMGSSAIVDDPGLGGLTGWESQHCLPGTIVADDFDVKAAIDFR